MAETKELMTAADFSVPDVVDHISKIRDLMKAVMVEGLHYGVIPGTDKPSLLQPGAQKLCLAFRIGDKNIELVERDLGGSHREYRIRKQMIHLPSGTVLCETWGSCSTMESRYRWRRSGELVGDVPVSYWKISRDDLVAREDELVRIFGPGKYRLRKSEGQWKAERLSGKEERTENQDLADCYNTILQIADKRAYVRGTIKALAASDLFMHEQEDSDDDDEDGSAGARSQAAGAKDKIAEASTRQVLIERIARAVDGDENKKFFTDGERKTYSAKIKFGGPAGKPLPTGELEKFAEQIEAALAGRKAGSSNSLNAAAEAGWNEAPPIADPTPVTSPRPVSSEIKKSPMGSPLPTGGAKQPEQGKLDIF